MKSKSACTLSPAVTFLLSSALAGVTLTACGSASTDGAATGTSANALLLKNDAPIWPNGTVDYCWSTDGYAQEKAWVNADLRKTWGRYAMIEFNDFGVCAPLPQEPQLQITINSSPSYGATSQTAGYGLNTSRQIGGGLTVWWPADGTTPRGKVGADIVHEFGHVLGFAHDQNSYANTTGECWAVQGDPIVPNIESGSISTIGAYDHFSIMNYCSDKGAGVLSPGDKVNIGIVYGARPLVPGRSDIVWRNVDTGQYAIWQMNGTDVTTFGGGIWTTTSSEIVGTGNFSGASLLMLDGARFLAIRLSGTAYAGYTDLGIDLTNKVVKTTGDMDGDGITDIVWMDTTTGEYGVWMLDDGPSVRSTTLFSNLGGVIGGIGSDWVLKGTGDFDGNGMADLFWQNQNDGELAIWQNTTGWVGDPIHPLGTVMSLPPAFAWTPTGSTIGAIGDFDGDSTTDIAWRDAASGDVTLWLTKSSMFYSPGTPNVTVGRVTVASRGVPPAWTIADSGDFDGDGKSDLLWRNDDGSVAVWLMDGIYSPIYGSAIGAPNAWRLNGTIGHDPTPR